MQLSYKGHNGLWLHSMFFWDATTIKSVGLCLPTDRSHHSFRYRRFPRLVDTFDTTSYGCAAQSSYRARPSQMCSSTRQAAQP